MNDISVRVNNLGKRYRIGGQQGQRHRYKSLRDTLAGIGKWPSRLATSLIGGKQLRSRSQTFWALDNVSFEIKRGEVVGVIGRNGAGKSTLLKVLCRITEPTRGRIEIRGRVGSLLEVGTGFHPELSGRDNVYLNGAILGMRRAEIRRRFDEIVAFAEVEKFIDTPVKHYSSGMYLRLAFAVAAHLEPEILVVDEVLAVGDQEFQKKCLGKMEDVSKGGRSVIFVSHNMGAISRLCGRSIWLDRGAIVKDGLSPAVVAEYQTRHVHTLAQWVRPPTKEHHADFIFHSVRLRGPDGASSAVFDGNSPITVGIEYQVSRTLQACQVGVRLYTADSLVVFTTADSDEAGVSALPKRPGQYTASFTIPGRLLAPGTYYLQLGAHVPQRHIYDAIDQSVVFEVTQSSSLSSLDGRWGVICPLLPWTLRHEGDHGGSPSPRTRLPVKDLR